MPSHSMNRSVLTLSFRATSRRLNFGSKTSRWEPGSSKPWASRRCFTSGDHEQLAVHMTAVHTADESRLEQKRSISTAELDKYKDTRERIVVLGSGWAGYTLSK